MPWKRRRPAPPSELSAAEITRAARVLAVRSRRATASLFAGGYRSAFRGGGLEFEESRPYAPGDDVRTLDWNALARTGEPFVKQFREERDQTLLLLLDVSSSMRFGTRGRSKAGVAAHAAALLAAAAGQAGDRVGLLAFAEEVRCEVRPGRGEAHAWRVIRTAVEEASRCGGGTDLGAALTRVAVHAPPRSVVLLLSDFRSPDLPRSELAQLSRRHDLVAAVIDDPRDEELPTAGRVRLVDPEAPGRRYVLDTNSRSVRKRYARAAAARRRMLERTLRGWGVDVLWMRTDRDPLGALVRFFPAHRAGVRAAS